MQDYFAVEIIHVAMIMIYLFEILAQAVNARGEGSIVSPSLRWTLGGRRIASRTGRSGQKRSDPGLLWRVVVIYKESLLLLGCSFNERTENRAEVRRTTGFRAAMSSPRPRLESSKRPTGEQAGLRKGSSPRPRPLPQTPSASFCFT